MSYSRVRTMAKRKSRRKGRLLRLLALNLSCAGCIAAVAAIWYLADGVSGGERQPAGSPRPAMETVPPSAEKPSLPDESGEGKTDIPAWSPGDESDPAIPAMPAGSMDGNEADSAHGKIKLAFVGDILPASSVLRQMETHGYDYPFRLSADLLRSADITAGNLEAPLTARGTPAENKDYVYRGPAAVLPAIKDAGFDVLSLANNHTMDYGWIGLQDTMAALDEHQIRHMGAGHDEMQAYAPAYVEANGFKVAFIGLSNVIWKVDWKADKKRPGLAEAYDITRALAAIQEADRQADLVVVMVHWGVEYSDRPIPDQVAKGRKFIDAGADLVIGCHPHVLQGFEWYNGKWIAYSLGNFVFSGTKSPESAKTGVLMAECGKNTECSLQFYPMLAKAAQPALMEEAEASALLARLSAVSTAATVEENGMIVAKR